MPTDAGAIGLGSKGDPRAQAPRGSSGHVSVVCRAPNVRIAVALRSNKPTASAHSRRNSLGRILQGAASVSALGKQPD